MQTDLFDVIERKLDSATENSENETSRREIREAHQFLVCLQDRLEHESNVERIQREHGG